MDLQSSGLDDTLLADLDQFAYPDTPLKHQEVVNPRQSTSSNNRQQWSNKRRRVANAGPVNADNDNQASSSSDEEVDERYNSDGQYEAIKFGEFGKYMANKRKKLKVQEAALRDTDSASKQGLRPQIFKSLTIHVNGYTTTPLAELRRLIVLHGGTYMAYLDQKTAITHIIATALTPKKREEFRKYKIARPEWITESIAAGRLLRWSEFGLLTQPSAGVMSMAMGEVTGGTAASQQVLSSFKVTSSSTKKVTPKTTSAKTVTVSSEKLALAKTVFKGTPQISSDTAANAPSVDKLTDNAEKWTTPLEGVTDPWTEGYLPEARNPHRDNLLHDDAWLAQHSAIAPDFIKGFFEQSRLHHLSTWKAELLKNVGELLEERKANSKTLTVAGPTRKIKGDASDGRTFMHVDFDCFFVTAGFISRPELRGKPVVVCHAKGNASVAQSSTSEIASCSYEARAFGVKNGMSLGRAREMCPAIVTMPYDFKVYASISLAFYNILLAHADDLQAVSVDEALIDVSTSLPATSTHATVLEFAENLRQKIKNETQCDASIGISHNILLARLATRKAKPAGVYHLLPDQVMDHLSTLDVEELPGVGWNQRSKIEEVFKTTLVKEVGELPLVRVQDALGENWGKTVYMYAQGIDTRSLKSGQPRKSVSADINYGIRFKPASEGGLQQMETFMKGLGEEVSKRLQTLKLRGRHLTLKVMKRSAGADSNVWKFLGHGPCDEVSRACKISGPRDVATDDSGIIGDVAWKTMCSLEIPPEDLRGVGIQIQKLEATDATTSQQVLPFKLQAETEVVVPEVVVIKSSSVTRPTLPETVAVLHQTQFDIPTISQIDPEVLAAMPREIQLQVANRKAPIEEAPRPILGLASPSKRNRSPVIVEVIDSKGKTVDRRGKKKLKVSVVDYGQSRLVAAGTQAVMKCAKVRRTTMLPDPKKITNAELSALGIDVDFFKSLNATRDLQLDILTNAVQLYPDALDDLKKQFNDEPSRRGRSKTPNDNNPNRGVVPLHYQGLVVNVVANPCIKKRSSQEEVCLLIDQWIQSCGYEVVPDPGDVDRFTTFLLQCVDKKRGSGQDLEKVVDIVNWWDFSLESRRRKRQRQSASASEERWKVCDESWQRALENVKQKLNQVTVLDHGAALFV